MGQGGAMAPQSSYSAPSLTPNLLFDNKKFTS